jgi:hypothetical protein
MHKELQLLARGVHADLGAAARPRSIAWVGGRFSPSRCFRLRRRTDRTAIELQPRDADCRRHLEALQDLSRSRIDQPQIALVARSRSKRRLHRLRSRLPGCLLKSRGSFRSPAPRSCIAWTRNLGAVALELTPDDLRDIDSAVSRITVQGARYPEQPQQQVGR